MSANNDTQMVFEALTMAVKNKPKQQIVLPHSDQGATYRAYGYINLFKANNINQSMSRKGQCHDNAVAKSFFNTLKTELINQQTYLIRKQAQSSIFVYIEVFYNKPEGIQLLIIALRMIMKKRFIKKMPLDLILIIQALI